MLGVCLLIHCYHITNSLKTCVVLVSMESESVLKTNFDTTLHFNNSFFSEADDDSGISSSDAIQQNVWS